MRSSGAAPRAFAPVIAMISPIVMPAGFVKNDNDPKPWPSMARPDHIRSQPRGEARYTGTLVAS
jgi:hypothetical protein